MQMISGSTTYIMRQMDSVVSVLMVYYTIKRRHERHSPSSLSLKIFT